MNKPFSFDIGIDLRTTNRPLGFCYGEGAFGPSVEQRRLDDIRKNLMDPHCQGPEIVYAIAMDVGMDRDLPAIRERNLLYGAVTYAQGKLGREPIRSQGHIHAVSPSCGESTCEVYEIWEGKAIIYMQETAKDNPGRCFAVIAEPGDVVIVPPGWAHSTIVADTEQQMSFGAWCVRDYGFDYVDVRAHGGLAWFPVVEDKTIVFEPNTNYQAEKPIVKRPRIYRELGLEEGKSIYRQFTEDPDRFLFVSQPQRAKKLWENFVP